MKKLFIFLATVLLAFAVGCQTGTNPDVGKDSDISKESVAFTYEVTDEGTICITGVTEESVSELVIPKKIDGKQVTEIGRYAFYGCENLKSVELTNVVKIGKGAFSGCVNLESVSMPKVETIKDKAFLDCAKLTKVELPEDVEIADNAFEGCDSLPVRMPTATPTPTSTPTPTPTPTLTPTPTPTPTPTVTPTPTAVPVDIAQFKNAKVGDTVVFGSYEQDNNIKNGKEEIEWLVLEKTDDKILVISKYALDCQQYNETFEDVTWETCTMRKWLNNEFFNAAFTAEEQKLIPTVTVTAEDNPEYGTDAGNDTKDKVFLLSISEVKNYFATNAARMCKPTAYAVAQGAYVNYDYSSLGSWWWWLRSPGYYQTYAAYVHDFGLVLSYGDRVDDGIIAVRPALWINLNADTADQNGTYENVPTPTPAATAGSTNDKQFKNAKVGETVVFGSYEQDNNTKNGKEEIEWIVLEKTDDKILVISKYALDCQPYNETFEDVTWETCTLRKWLNNEFLNTAFTNEEQKLIPTVTVTAEDNPFYGTDAGNDTKDKVFLLSISEAEDYFTDDDARMCEPTAYAVAQGAYVNYDYSSLGSCWWWLRSPGDYRSYAADVGIGGRVLYDGFYVDYLNFAVRPALWINLNP